MDTTIFDPEQGFGARVRKTGELLVEASVPGTVDVNVASTSDALPTTPGPASSVNFNQVDVDTTSGGTQIVASQSRKGILITNLDATRTVYLGFGSAPTIGTGFPIAPGASLALPAGVTTDAEIKAITASGTARIAFAEFT